MSIFLNMSVGLHRPRRAAHAAVRFGFAAAPLALNAPVSDEYFLKHRCRVSA